MKRKNRSTWWHQGLWEQVRREASTLTGQQVIAALEESSEAIWSGGLDAAFAMRVTQGTDFEDNAEAFDIGWLTVFSLKLSEMNEPDPAKRARKALDRLSTTLNGKRS